MEMCRDKGFVAVDPDNVDGFTHEGNGISPPLTAADQLDFNRSGAGGALPGCDALVSVVTQAFGNVCPCVPPTHAAVLRQAQAMGCICVITKAFAHAITTPSSLLYRGCAPF